MNFCHCLPPSSETNNPNSVPAYNRFRFFGSSRITWTFLYDVTPSFFESWVRSPGAPISDTLLRSTCFVRSALAIQVSPRLYDLNNRLPPNQTMLGLCGDRTTGVFQLKRYRSPGSPFRTFGGPPRPPNPPGCCSVSAGASAGSTPRPARGGTGRILLPMPVRRSYRFVLPFCDSVMTMLWSVGSTAV